MRSCLIHARDNADDDEDLKYKVKQLTLSWRKIYPGGTVSQYKSFAMLPEEVFEELRKIFTGKIAKFAATKNHKSFKPPKSMSNFVRMGNIPSDVQLTLLKRVTQQGDSTAQFKTNCLNYKGRERIGRLCLKLLQVKTLAAAYEKYAPLFSQDIFEGICLNHLKIVAYLKQKDHMPDSLVTTLSGILIAHKSQAKAASQVQSFGERKEMVRGDFSFFFFFLFSFRLVNIN
jgi:hypothetical protein